MKEGGNKGMMKGRMGRLIGVRRERKVVRR